MLELLGCQEKVNHNNKLKEKRTIIQVYAHNDHFVCQGIFCERSELNNDPRRKNDHYVHMIT